MLGHSVPVFLLKAPLLGARAVGFLVGGEMAKAGVLEVEGELEFLRVASLNLDVFASEPKLGLAVEEVEVVVDPDHPLAAGPVVAEQLDEDVRKNDLGVLFDLLVEPDLLVDQLLAPGQGQVDVVVLRKTPLGCPFQPIADQFRVDSARLFKLLEELEVTKLAGLVHPIRGQAEPFLVIEVQALASSGVEPDQEEKGDDGGASPALAVVAVHRHNRPPAG